MGIISWYEGDNDYPAARKAKMKALSVKWLALLNEEHADGNFSGTQKLYETLRMKHKEDGAQAYPSRSFVNDFLQRQFNEQRFKRTKKKRHYPSNRLLTSLRDDSGGLPVFLLPE